jgi:hypothetical protein
MGRKGWRRNKGRSEGIKLKRREKIINKRRKIRIKGEEKGKKTGKRRNKFQNKIGKGKFPRYWKVEHAGQNMLEAE